jgi:hypothetical protein
MRALYHVNITFFDLIIPVITQSVYRWATGWTIGVLGFDCRRGLGTFHHRDQNGSGAHPASYPMGNRALSVGSKRPGRETDDSPPSSAEIKECVELYFHSSNTPSWRGDQLKKAEG